MKVIYIYALLHPITNEVRYIGKTNNLRNRYLQHCNQKLDTYCAKWIKSLKPLKPEMIILEEVLEKDWKETEQFWIAYIKSLGAKLANATKGGDGTHGRILSEEVKHKISQSKMGLKLSKESLNKIKETRKNWTEEQKVAFSNKFKKPHSEEAREKMRQAKLGRKHSEETKSKIAASMIGNVNGKR